eukprot:gene33455-41279_t
MKSKQRSDRQSKDSDANGASRQSGAPGSASLGRADAQGGAIDRKEESRRSRSEEARSEVSRSASRSGSRNR